MDALTQKSVHTSADIRKAVLINRAKTQDCLAGNDHYYRVDRHQAGQYLGGLPKWQKRMRVYFNELRTQGVRTVYADICGRARGMDLGAEHSYTFSLQPVSKFYTKVPNETFIEGDVFNARDFYSFINLIRSRGDLLAFATFEPIVGLQSYIPFESKEHRKSLLHSDVTCQRLANNLKKLIEVVRPGGYIFLDKPFQFGEYDGLEEFFSGIPREQNKLSLWLKKFCRENRCSIEMDSIIGLRYLIRKWAKRRKVSRT